MDEAVVIDADRDPLDHFQRRRALAPALDHVVPDARAGLGEPLAPLFGRLRMNVLPRGGQTPSAARGLPAARPSRRRTVRASASLAGRSTLKLDQLVAALAVLAGEAAALEAQHLARGRSLGDGQHHRAFDRRHLDLGAEHRLVERHRQVEADIVAVADEEGVRRDLDRDDRVAAARRARPGPGRRGGSWCRPRPPWAA